MVEVADEVIRCGKEGRKVRACHIPLVLLPVRMLSMCCVGIRPINTVSSELAVSLAAKVPVSLQWRHLQGLCGVSCLL